MDHLPPSFGGCLQGGPAGLRIASDAAQASGNEAVVGRDAARTCAAPGCGLAGTHVCAGCRKVRYCPRACQKLHWRSHEEWCLALQPGGLGLRVARP